MSHLEVVTWVCDRCSRKVSRMKDEPPPGWHWVTAGPLWTPEYEPGDAVNWEVCAGCYSQVERLLMNQKNVEAA